MTEDFLHFIWRTRNFNFQHLHTTEGRPLEILDFGTWNTGAGPDFSMARIRLDGTEWAGNIEMHCSASEWDKHRHSHDPLYASVVLHVVIDEDVPIYLNARRLPCIELKRLIDNALIGRYTRLMANAHWVPCAGHLNSVSPLAISHWLDRMVIERLQLKADALLVLAKTLQHNWEEVFYRALAMAFGFKANAAPFERLARKVPLQLTYKHADTLFQLEAMFFGAAGMLNKIFTEDYPVSLQREFHHLDHKYALGAIDAHAWMWGHLRPPNFPVIRIAQFAAVMSQFRGLLSAVLEAGDVTHLRKLLDTPVSTYWTTHWNFDRPAPNQTRQMGAQSIDGLLINTVIPFMYCYGLYHKMDGFLERAVDLMSALASESNSITRNWVRIGMPNAHAAHSQALIHLKAAYCDRKRCVACGIGNQILSSIPE